MLISLDVLNSNVSIDEQILEIARQRGVVRAGDLLAGGSTSHDLRRLVAQGILSRVGRGLYTLSGFEFTEAHGIVEAVQAQSKAVVCLLSALAFHVIGTQQPHQAWLAIPYGARISQNRTVPTRVVVMRPSAYEHGIEVHRLEGVDVPIYSVAKTVADCFKFRNTVGLDVAIEALREALRDRRCTREDIRQFARIDRVEKVMRPYMEALSA
jgi:predicted transcriptional regulator of viral defense system